MADERARSVYALRVGGPRGEQQTNAKIKTLLAGLIQTFVFWIPDAGTVVEPRVEVRIVERDSGHAARSWSVSEDVAHTMSVEIGDDLDRLTREQFEAEWSIPT